MGDKTRGLYQKFIVSRTDGKSNPGKKHDACEYFVLDLNHDRYSIKTLLKYAELCEKEYPELAVDLKDKAIEIAHERHIEQNPDYQSKKEGNDGQ